MICYFPLSRKRVFELWSVIRKILRKNVYLGKKKLQNIWLGTPKKNQLNKQQKQKQTNKTKKAVIWNEQQANNAFVNEQGFRSHGKKAINRCTKTKLYYPSLNFGYFTSGSAFKGHRFSSFFIRLYICCGSWGLTASGMRINADVKGALNNNQQLLSAVKTQTQMKERYSDLGSVFVSVYTLLWCIMSYSSACCIEKNWKET